MGTKHVEIYREFAKDESSILSTSKHKRPGNFPAFFIVQIKQKSSDKKLCKTPPFTQFYALTGQNGRNRKLALFENLWPYADPNNFLSGVNAAFSDASSILKPGFKLTAPCQASWHIQARISDFYLRFEVLPGSER